MSLERRRWAGALGLALAFFAAGAYHIDEPGLQADETLFVQGVWENGRVEQETRVFGWRFPLMQMPYLGGLKPVLYVPVFKLFGVSAASVRLPMVLAGAVTVALTFLLLWRLSGSERAAWLGGALLAADPTFLFTTRCDWGPVALERLLCVGGAMFFVTGRINWGAFLFGLALWNKSTFLWTLIGLAAGMAIVYRAKLRIRPLALGLALLCFSAGAYPWIRHNVRTRGGTARVTARFDASDLNGKLFQLRSSLEGTSVYGYLMRDGDAGPWPRANAMPWLLMAAAVLAAVSRHRLALFFMTVMGAAWLAMALTYGAGGSSHHVVLLWPWPHCIVALAAARWRWWFAPIVALGVLMSAGVVVRHYVLLDRYGSNPPWSEAIYPLAARIAAEQPRGLVVTDWGLLEPVLLFTRGAVPFEVGFHRHLPPEHFASLPGWIFAGHVDGREAFQGVNALWKQVKGYRRVEMGVFKDRQGFPIFELFRFERYSPVK